MKIAVTYDNGEIFQHFGKCGSFKVYTVENSQVVKAEILGSNGSGHSALAGLLANNDINVLICGGIGGGAQSALSAEGIAIFSGHEGNADAAVAAYLRGELSNAGVNCDHHDHEEGHECHCHDDSEEEGCGCGGDCSCGDDSEGGCGCGGGCGGCGRPQIEGKNVGRVVSVHYLGTFNDGTKFDSSYDRGQPLTFQCGAGMMILGFDQAVANMEVGETLDIHLMPEEAYGMPDPNAIFMVGFEELPGCEELNIGERIILANAMGQQFPVTVVDKTDVAIVFDANHEMAGKELNFKIELVSIQ